MSNELITVEPKNALTIFTESDQLDEIIKQVEMEVATFEHDMTNDARRKRTASLANKVARTKTYLDGLGKDLVSDWKAKSKVVDENRKKMRDRLDELKAIARKPLTEWEDEQERIAAEKAAAEEAARIAEEIEQAHEIALLLNDKFDRDLAEKIAEEKRIEEERQKKIEAERAEREQQIRKQAAEEAERKAKAEAERIEREKQEAIERAERAERERIAAEERAKIEAELAEKRRIEAEEKARRDAEIAAEQARQAEIERQKAEEKRIADELAAREANKKHISNIRKQAKESLMSVGLDEDLAKAVVMAIHNGNIANVKINY